MIQSMYTEYLKNISRIHCNSHELMTAWFLHILKNIDLLSCYPNYNII
ncbi:hypothetical protein BMW23_0878 [Bodo saltans virus]|uniref:Uncharacterized protein n=1 Tax=Bodo saltans virus TaxID=2024608 RepID=A0A2H4UVH2_9VIRU|nr:hypothetical protein QJ851_gp0860 [Bodo saltans virus]ATZ80923.1 hypothetical protein BMW23_0878 [Bodo saltans virus]